MHVCHSQQWYGSEVGDFKNLIEHGKEKMPLNGPNQEV